MGLMCVILCVCMYKRVCTRVYVVFVKCAAMIIHMYILRQCIYKSMHICIHMYSIYILCVDV